MTTNKTKKQKKPKTNFKTIIRENNLRTLYLLIFALAVLIAFPKLVDYVMLWVSLILVAGLGLIGYVVVNRTIDYRNRSLPERLIQSLPIEAFKYRSTSKVLGSSNQAWKLIEPMKQIEAVEEIVIDAIPTVKQLSLNEAIKQSNSESWLIGQNEQAYCDINIRDLVHIGLIGKTGSGKTASTALLTMVYGLKSKFHVIALDAKEGVDWQRYNDYIEAYPTNYEVFPSQIDQLVSLHDSRMMLVKKHGVANIDEIEGNAIPHVLVICEEYGHVCQALQAANKKSFNDTISKMSNLMRVSRATGIHFLLIDQLPNHWPQTIKANVGGMIGYRIKGQLANGFGMYKLGDLKPVGQFAYDDDVYDAWFTKAEIDSLLKKQAKRKNSLLVEYRSEAAQLKEVDCSVVIEETTRLIEDSSAALPTPPCQPIIQNTIQKTLPRAVSNRLDFVNQLIELAKTEQLNDSKIRKYCKEITGKSVDGVASKVILDYVNSKVQN